MAVYKVPQDVEAEDKLLGPLSFRQFIYLIVALISAGLCYFLGSIFLPLFIIPAPIVVIFFILSLPLKKDQPMEIYAAAILSFYLRPRIKLWDPDGELTMVEFTDNVSTEKIETPEITFDEAKKRIVYLSKIVDASGRMVRSDVVVNPVNNNLKDDIISESTQAIDVQDQTATVSQNFDYMLNQANVQQREHAINNMYQHTAAPASQVAVPQAAQPQAVAPQPTVQQQPVQPQAATPQPVVQPQPAQPQLITTPPVQPAKPEPSQQIVNLANNPDLSIQTMAAEANRINQNKNILGSEDEIFISLK